MKGRFSLDPEDINRPTPLRSDFFLNRNMEGGGRGRYISGPSGFRRGKFEKVKNVRIGRSLTEEEKQREGPALSLHSRFSPVRLSFVV